MCDALILFVIYRTHLPRLHFCILQAGRVWAKAYSTRCLIVLDSGSYTWNAAMRTIDFALLVFNIFLAGVLLFADQGSVSQMYLGLAITFIVVLITTRCMPYKNVTTDRYKVCHHVFLVHCRYILMLRLMNSIEFNCRQVAMDVVSCQTVLGAFTHLSLDFPL